MYRPRASCPVLFVSWVCWLLRGALDHVTSEWFTFNRVERTTDIDLTVKCVSGSRWPLLLYFYFLQMEAKIIQFHLHLMISVYFKTKHKQNKAHTDMGFLFFHLFYDIVEYS